MVPSEEDTFENNVGKTDSDHLNYSFLFYSF